MFYSPPKYNKEIKNFNDELLKLDGELDDFTAKVTLAEFMKRNIGFGCELITGFAPYEYQELLLKAFFNRNFSMMVAARGGAKSTIGAVIGLLIAIFEPNTTIGVLGPVFRTARNIFAEMEKIIDSKEATLLKQCIDKIERRNDLYKISFLNGSRIVFSPLNGQYARGLRVQTLILDEFLLLTEDIVTQVLFPFLMAPADVKNRIKIREKEDELIRQGRLEEKDRTKFENTARMIALSSASYSFEYLAKLYNEWIENIYSKNPVEDANYFVCNISYHALPPDMVQSSVIQEAKAAGEETAYFKREYLARFTDENEGFFAATKMYAQTVKPGDSPTIQLQVKSEETIAISIDPSFSNAPNSDDFAFCVGKILPNKEFVVIHNYAEAGTGLKDHIKYFYYLLVAFNPSIIISDNSDGNFLQSCNESALFKKNNLKLDFIDYDGELEGQDYEKMLRDVRNQYNKLNHKICFKKIFTTNSIRRMNEQLQTFINNKKVWFGSKITPNELVFNETVNSQIPYEFDDGESIIDLIDKQDSLMDLLKKETGLIEIRSSPTGHTVFDLPANLKRDSSPTRCRRDSYTALLLLAEAVKAYNDLMRKDPTPKQSLFTPIMLGNSTFR
ncbi:MAG: hypothetical protein Q7R95_02330 [bacterium]|nr:hypothetical protein [bacterium]